MSFEINSGTVKSCTEGDKPCDQRWEWAFEGWTGTVMESCATHTCAPAESGGRRDFILTNRNSDQIITTGVFLGEIVLIFKNNPVKSLLSGS